MPITINGSGTITGVSVGGLPDGIVDTDMLAADAVTDAKQNLSGAAKAWVNFNGTGTVAIRDSFNVSSITDNGTGDYTVNFTTAFPSANYAVSFGGQDVASSLWWRGLGSGYSNNSGFSTSSYRFQTWNPNFVVADTEICTLVFFGD